jgi:cytosine/adenosine deaminase-related metal-dependent hydrolase
MDAVSHCPVSFVRRARFLDSWPQVISRNLFAATAAEAFTAATIGGTELLGRRDFGRLDAGARGDILVIDLRGKVPMRDPVKFVVECGVGDDLAARS